MDIVVAKRQDLLFMHVRVRVYSHGIVSVFIIPVLLADMGWSVVFGVLHANMTSLTWNINYVTLLPVLYLCPNQWSRHGPDVKDCDMAFWPFAHHQRSSVVYWISCSLHKNT